MNRLVDYDLEEGEIETDDEEKPVVVDDRVDPFDSKKQTLALLLENQDFDNFHSDEGEIFDDHDELVIDDPEVEPSILSLARGKFCIICKIQDPKYRCPACELKTCSLKCCQRHKISFDCDGSVRRSRMVPLSKYDNLTMLNDYRFLEEAARLRQVCQKKKQLDTTSIQFKSWHFLNKECRRRRIKLLRLPIGLEKNLANQSSYDRNAETIFWNVDWIFVSANNLRVQTQRIPETVTLSTLLQQFLQPKPWSDHVEVSKKLTGYDLTNTKCFLKVEHNRWIKDQRYYELDVSKCLKDNLCNKTLIEYPTIYACLPDCQASFKVLTEEAESLENNPFPKTFLPNQRGGRKRNFRSKKRRFNRFNVKKVSKKDEKLEETSETTEINKPPTTKPLKRLLPLTSTKTEPFHFKRQNMVIKNQAFRQEKLETIKQVASELLQKENERQCKGRRNIEDEKLMDITSSKNEEIQQKQFVKTDFFGVLGDIDVLSNDSDDD